ncbi:MAG: hypothetical protein AAF598_16160, partial [Bacteroidota bacterium]
SYTITSDLDVDGNTSSSTDDYTNVTGTGTYTATEDELTILGSFFDLTVDGFDFSGFDTGSQTVNYSIDGNILTISQEETTEDSSGGFTTTSTNSSVSTWELQ